MSEVFTPGVSISSGRNLTPRGPTLFFRNFFETIRGLANRPLLAEHQEVAIASIRGAPPIHVLCDTLLEYPQMCWAYNELGQPILVGVRDATKAHINLCGQSRCGKTTTGATIMSEAVWHDCPVIMFGNKIFDPTLYAIRAAAESVNRPFRLITLDQKMPTSGVNYLKHVLRDPTQLPHLVAGHLMDGLDLSAPTEDRAGQFFAGAQLDHLTDTLAGFMNTYRGQSLRDLADAIIKKRLNRDESYAIAALKNALSQSGRIPQLNLSPGDPSDVDFEWVVEKRAAVYIEAASLRNGDISDRICGLLLQAFMTAKEVVDPLNKITVFMLVDEAADFPRPLLRRVVNKAAALNIRLVFAFQCASQFGDDEFENLVNTQISLVFSAKPGSKTERYLQASFGTKREYRIATSIGTNQQNQENWGEGRSDPIGGTGLEASHSSSHYGGSKAAGSHKDFNITRDEVPAWSADDTKWLNDSPLVAAMSVTPREELTRFSLEPGGNRITLGGPPFPFEEIDRIAARAYEPSTVTFLPGSNSQPRHVLPPSGRTLMEPSDERTRVLTELKALGTRIKNFKASC
jgi:hypothetical protein